MPTYQNQQNNKPAWSQYSDPLDRIQAAFGLKGPPGELSPPPTSNYVDELWGDRPKPTASDTLSEIERGLDTELHNRTVTYDRANILADNANRDTSDLVVGSRRDIGDLNARMDEDRNTAYDAIRNLSTLTRDSQGVYNDMYARMEETLNGLGDPILQKEERDLLEIRKQRNEALTAHSARATETLSMLDTQMEAALAANRTDRAEAIGKLMEGQASALNTATDGIQAQFRQVENDIDSSLGMSAETKTAMKARNRLGAANQMVGAVNQARATYSKFIADTMTSYDTLSSQIRTSLATTRAQTGATLAGQEADIFKGFATLETEIRDTATGEIGRLTDAKARELGALTREQANAFITSNEVVANQTANLMNSITNIEQQRAAGIAVHRNLIQQAQTANNEFQQGLLPFRERPYIDPGSIAVFSYDMYKELFGADQADAMTRLGYEALLQSQEVGSDMGLLQILTSAAQVGPRAAGAIGVLGLGMGLGR